MPSNLSPVVRAVLASLLDQAEQPNRQRVARVRLDDAEHPLYFSERDVAPRREANESFVALEQRGLVKLHWRKFETHNWLNAVDLVAEHTSDVYALLNRTPHRNRQQALRDLLNSQPPRPGWHRDFLTWANQQIDLHHSVAPLDLENPQHNAELVRALAALADLTTPTLERRFSVQVFGNSKRFEELRRAVLAVLHRHDPDAVNYVGDDDALFRAHHLDRVPEYVPMAGSVVLQVGASQVDLRPFVPSLSLPATLLRNASIVECAARAIVTIENATSFNEFVAIRPPSVFAIFTGGFASPTVIAFLQQLRLARNDLQFYHWGDLDVGGFRILAHLRAKLDIAPIGMDAATLDEFRSCGQLLSPSERIALGKLCAHPNLADCVTVLESLLAENCKLEQEAIDLAGIVQSFR